MAQSQLSSEFIKCILFPLISAINVSVSQTPNAKDSPQCGTVESPCRTIYHGSKRCLDQVDQYLLCTILVDGGPSSSKVFEYFIDNNDHSAGFDCNQGNDTLILGLTIQGKDPNVRPVISCSGSGWSSSSIKQTCTMQINSCNGINLKGLRFQSSSSQLIAGLDVHLVKLKESRLMVSDCNFDYVNISLKSQGGGEFNNCTLYRCNLVITSVWVTSLSDSLITESYLEGILQITDSVLKDSALELSLDGGISSTNVTGSYKMDDVYLPQVVVINKYLPERSRVIQIEKSTFTESINGVIVIATDNLEMDAITILNSNFTKNRAFERKGIIDISNIYNIFIRDPIFDFHTVTLRTTSGPPLSFQTSTL